MKICGIYLLKQKDEVVYVGQSIDVELRILTHKKEAIKEFDNIHIIKCDLENLNSAETFYIHYYLPKYNKKLYEINAGVKTPRTVKTRNRLKSTIISIYDKPTDTNIAKFYGLSRMTMHNYKNGDEFKQRLYQAMKDYFIKQTLNDN